MPPPAIAIGSALRALVIRQPRARRPGFDCTYFPLPRQNVGWWTVWSFAEQHPRVAEWSGWVAKMPSVVEGVERWFNPKSGFICREATGTNRTNISIGWLTVVRLWHEVWVS